jgi:hypothetical protein
MTRRHKLFRKLRGGVYHVTYPKGLRGILDTGAISPNPDGKLSHMPGSYICQYHGAVSLLDLRLHREEGLFGTGGGIQNWAHVFSYNEPCVALELNIGAIEGNFIPLARDQILGKPGRFIMEAEICHRGPIVVSAIIRSHLIGRAKRWIAEFTDLEKAYSQTVACARRTRKQSQYPIGLLTDPSRP